MPILNYTTEVPPEKTILEITKILLKHGANKIVTDYEGQMAVGVTFCLNVNGSAVAFALPANYKGVLQCLKSDRDIANKYKTEEQAIRVSWRIIKDWIEAQMAIVEVKLADVAEVFLPYAVVNGKTLYNQIKDNGMKMLNS